MRLAVDELRGRLKKRRDNEDEIVALQARQVIMNWEGLGWRAPKQPTPPGIPNGLSIATTMSAENESGHLRNMLLTMIEKGEDEMAEAVLRGYVKRLSKIESTADLNRQVWDLYEAAKENLEDEDAWETLADVLESRDDLDANTLDTLAHLKYAAGDLKAALKAQKEAVAKLSEDGDIFGTGSQLKSYLKELEKEAEKKNTAR